jgi:hypothetical protein
MTPRLPFPIAPLLAAGIASFVAGAPPRPSGGAWVRHTIDGSSRGADGTRLADANGDGRLDIVTGWEEGGVVRLYLQPEPAKRKEPWPAVTVGKVGSPEDAVLVDLDGDGALDVVSSCEGKVRSLFVHWAPRGKGKLLDPAAWQTEALPAAKDARMWMFCLPLQVDGKNGIDLVVGSKNENAQIGWFEAPPRPRDLAAWKWHPMCDAGWIMSLVAEDMDGDGDLDVVTSDRKGPLRGAHWLENPGPGPRQAQPWTRHPIGAQGEEIMFLVLADLDRDGLRDVVTSVKPQEIRYLRRKSVHPDAWESFPIPFPPNTGGAKGIAVGDIDRDGKLDLLFSCEGATEEKSGVMWLSYPRSPTDRAWVAHEIGGTAGIKYDLLELLDLDGDGDLDVITSEERDNLGVIWYENPTR